MIPQNNKIQKRYQLVAIDKDTNKKIIIKIKNSNREQKVPLSVIDFGTSKFTNEEALAHKLHLDGQLPHSNFRFVISYKANGNKELPCIFNDTRIHEITNPSNKYLNNDNTLSRLRTSLLYDFIKIIKEGQNFDLFKYETINNRSNRNSGNYVNDRFFNQTSEFFINYLNKINDRKNAELYSESMEVLQKELERYKEYRTLYYYTHIYNYQNKLNKDVNITTEADWYKNTKEYKESQEKLYNTPSLETKKYEPTEEILTPTEKNDILMEQLYNSDNMDEFYSTYDLDELEEKHFKR